MSAQATSQDALEMPDRLVAIQSALECLIAQHSSKGDQAYYAAYFVQAQGINPGQLTALFSGHTPPVKAISKLAHGRSGLIDSDSGRPAKLFSVDELHITGETAVASVHWYSGPLAAEMLRLKLKKILSRWVVQSVEHGLIASMLDEAIEISKAETEFITIYWGKCGRC